MSTMRYPEIDIARTLAIALMFIYHIAFDLHEFYGWTIDPLAGRWKVLQVVTAALFLSLVGVSFVLSKIPRPHSTHRLKRVLHIFSAAILVTIGTYAFDPHTYVRFGILHMIGVSILLLPFFVRFKEWNVLIGIAMILFEIKIHALYQFIDSTIYRNTFLSALLTIIGLPSPTFTTMDYYPLLPWFGFILLGMGIGHFLYIRNLQWREKFSILNSPFSILTWPGKHALLLYLIHQPIILGILALAHTFSLHFYQ